MVFFVCESCNETLKRAHVDKHWYKCHFTAVTCVDCNVTFSGEDYLAHTTCISEAEKYEGALYRGPKGAVAGPAGAGRGAGKRGPHEVWMDTVRAAAEKASGSLRAQLQHVASLDNVPRCVESDRVAFFL